MPAIITHLAKLLNLTLPTTDSEPNEEAISPPKTLEKDFKDAW